MAQTAPTKRERREQARLEREMLLRKAARRKQLNRVGVVALVLVVVLGVTALVVKNHKSTATALGALPGLQTGPAPWPPEYANLTQRLKTMGFPMSSSMAANLHHHDLLQIYVDGRPVTVPSQVGINSSADYLTSLHTHDASGVIHVESPTQRAFTLGQFFDVWGVRLTSTCLGGYCPQGSATLKTFVNGKAYAGDPQNIPLTQHEDIVLAYGTPAELPNPIPATYSGSISPYCAPTC